ncbi:CHAT domain-containing protein [Lujinxingia vulgaris]|uniref:CHAT domain-containing protein n=1 Tax=Lujinxingia vulgaris TaxID=2600176 RepID=A0A5C6X8E5_9DELT|nr:CHAT domain-containing protein [Lujinxingia vulgaris]TXD34253.1 CHAT domain-containing protein [Lujinxingia vulgaris]
MSQPPKRKIYQTFANRLRNCDFPTALSLCGQTVYELHAAGEDYLDALQEVGRIFSLRVRPVPAAEVAWAVHQAAHALSQGTDESLSFIVPANALMSLVQQRYKKDKTICYTTAIMVTLIPRERTRLPKPILAHLYRQALELGGAITNPEERSHFENVRAHYADILSQLDRPEAMSESLSVFQQALKSLGAFQEQGIPDADESYAQCLYNYAMALKNRHFEDQTASLLQALEHFEHCRLLPARNRHLGARAMTTQMRQATVNVLIQLLDDPDEKIRLLEDGLAIAESELTDLDKRCTNTESKYNIPHIRESLWLAITNGKYLLLQTCIDAGEQLQDELREHCHNALLRFDEVYNVIGPDALAYRLQFQRALTREAQPLSEEQLLILLEHIERSMNQRQGYLTATEANHLLAAINNQNLVNLQPRTLVLLGSLMNHIHPITVGTSLSRMLFESEYSLLNTAAQKNWDAIEKYMTSSLESALNVVQYPIWSDSYRRVLAIRLARLATIHREWAAIDPVESLELFDLSHGQAYRTDLNFFGAGDVIEDEENLTDPTKWPEELWRLNLYRARIDFDTVCRLISVDDIARLHPERRDFMDQTRPALSMVGSYQKDGETIFGTIENPEARAGEIYEEISWLLRLGREKGWQPAVQEASVDGATLRTWLVEHPNTGVIAAGVGHVKLICADDKGAYSLNLLESLDENEIDRMESSVRLLRKADNAFRSGDVSDTSRSAFDGALKDHLGSLIPLSNQLVEFALARGLKNLVVLAQQGMDLVPWEYIPTNKADSPCLGQTFNMVRTQTLASVVRMSAQNKSYENRVTYIGVDEDSNDGLSLAAHLISDDSQYCGLKREEFDQIAMRARVLRLVTHGTHHSGILVPGFLLSGSPASVSIAPSSQDQIPEFTEQDRLPWFSVTEIKTLNMSGCRRVELWACESAQNVDVIGNLLNDNEPVGLSAAFLTAGASRVLGSWWKQPIASALLIARRFEKEVDDGDAFADAGALARAIAAYRDTVRPDGAFTTAVVKYVNDHLDQASSETELRRAAIRAGWSSAYEELTGESVPPKALEKFSLVYMGGFVDEPNRDNSLSGLRADPTAAVDDWMTVFRGPVSWAGWRIVARDRSTLED